MRKSKRPDHSTAFFHTLHHAEIPAKPRNPKVSFINGHSLIPKKERDFQSPDEPMEFKILTNKKASWLHKKLWPKSVHESGYIVAKKNLHLLKCWEAKVPETNQIIIVTKDGGNLVLPVKKKESEKKRQEVLGI